jgi:hypothetical protein
VSEERRSLHQSYEDLTASIDSLIELLKNEPEPYDKPMWRVKLWSNYQQMQRIVDGLIEYRESYDKTPKEEEE